jgi:AraC-like DNA-binding protein
MGLNEKNINLLNIKIDSIRKLFTREDWNYDTKDILWLSEYLFILFLSSAGTVTTGEQVSNISAGDCFILQRKDHYIFSKTSPNPLLRVFIHFDYLKDSSRGGTVVPYSGMKAEIKEVEASQFQFPNMPENTIDDDDESRWSCKGDGEWIQYDLGSIKKINGLKIKFFKGDIRASRFDLLASKDGKRWKGILMNAVSGGKTRDWQDYPFPMTEARYIKIIVHGNNLNDWNSITTVYFNFVGKKNSDSILPKRSIAQNNDDKPKPFRKIIDLDFFAKLIERVYYNYCIAGDKKQAKYWFVAALGEILLQDSLANLSDTEKKNMAKIEEVCARIRENIGHNPSIEELANEFSCSVSYLIRLFRKQKGLSPLQYILKAKIDHAKTLLFYTNQSISQIAEGLGYKNYFFFLKQFKKFTGKSPNEFRKSGLSTMDE